MRPPFSSLSAKLLGVYLSIPMSITTRSAAPGLQGDGSTCSATQIQAATCQQVDDSDCAEISASQVQLPEDILHRIHALLEMRDAAQAACVCRGFLRSWRCYPNLILSIYSLGIKKHASRKHEILGIKQDASRKHEILGIKQDAARKHEMAMEFVSRVDHILQNHSGMGVKIFNLETYSCSDLHHSYVDRWLQVAFTSRIENFRLSMFEGFLSNSCALKKIYLSNCKDIICLRIPCLLKELNILEVFSCLNLESIESNAPNLSIFSYAGDQIHMSLGHALQLRKVTFHNYDTPGALYYARTKLPFIAPNVQTLALLTRDETANTPMTYGRFLQLKYLEIVACAPIFTPDYDFGSLVSFLDASPALETFILRIHIPTLRPDSIVEDPGADSSRPQCLSECCHDHLKNVMITGFCSAKSMIELTIHIIEKTKSLACLTLDTTRGHESGCLKLSQDALVEAEKARVAI